MRIIFVILIFISLQSHGQIINASQPYRPFVVTSVQPDTAFLTSTPSGDLRNNYGDYVGFRFKTGSLPMNVTALGRWVVSGNSGSHTIKIATTTNTIVASATINTSGLGVGYNYVSITPVTLAANTFYYVVSLEVNGGDKWHDQQSATSTTAGNSLASAYQLGGTFAIGNTGQSYVPTNFKYYR